MPWRLIGGIIAIMAGIVIIIWPAVIAWVIGIFLILVGIIALTTSNLRNRTISGGVGKWWRRQHRLN